MNFANSCLCTGHLLFKNDHVTFYNNKIISKNAHFKIIYPHYFHLSDNFELYPGHVKVELVEQNNERSIKVDSN